MRRVAAVINPTGTVDVGEVNGRTFINNASLGLYLRIVRERTRPDVVCRRRFA